MQDETLHHEARRLVQNLLESLKPDVVQLVVWVLGTEPVLRRVQELCDQLVEYLTSSERIQGQVGSLLVKDELDR